MLALALTSRFCSDQTPPWARNGGSRRIKAPNRARAQLFLDFISVKCFKDVEVLESTQRAPENTAQAMKFVT